MDKIVLERYLNVYGVEDNEVLKWAYLNSFYQTGLKNLLDIAVLDHVEVKDYLKVEETYDKIDEIPFDFQRRRTVCHTLSAEEPQAPADMQGCSRGGARPLYFLL
jgi:magnesium-transporting ATPase (P-type)